MPNYRDHSEGDGMTHDELIAYIDDSTDGLKHEHLFAKLLANTKALRAVVELHKPVQGESDIQTYDYIGCDACVEWSHDGSMNVAYPCLTIQAIEKELQ